MNPSRGALALALCALLATKATASIWKTTEQVGQPSIYVDEG